MINLLPLRKLALEADSPGLIGPIENEIALLTHKFTTTPVLIGGTTAGAVAVNYIANSLLAQGATPRYATVCFTVNTSVADETIAELAASTRKASVDAEMEIAAVDAVAVSSDMTSSVQIAMTGLGEQRPDTDWGGYRVKSGDIVIVTGAVGTHGAALAQARTGVESGKGMASDSAALGDIVHALQNSVPDSIRCLVYPFAGLNAAIKQIEAESGARVEVEHDRIPVTDEVSAEAKLMGVSPLDLETAGAMVVVVSAQDADNALAAIKRSSFGADAAEIGVVR